MMHTLLMKGKSFDHDLANYNTMYLCDSKLQDRYEDHEIESPAAAAAN